MAQKGRFSSKKGSPSYVMAIVGVTSVLFIISLFGWLILNANKYSNVLREDVEMHVYLLNTAQKSAVDGLQNYITAQPYAREVKFIDKETARQQLIASDGKDFLEFLDSNPLPEEISLKVKSTYVNKDSLAKIAAEIGKNQMLVEEVRYPVKLVDKMSSVLKWIIGGLLALAALLFIMALVMIDNTIRLSMYSNRFLIKTMQMVGATRWFITKPMDIRAIINGSVAGLITILLMLGVVKLSESFVPDLRILRENDKLVLLLTGVFILGILISLVSTHRSIVKYLKLKLDELY